MNITPSHTMAYAILFISLYASHLTAASHDTAGGFVHSAASLSLLADEPGTAILEVITDKVNCSGYLVQNYSLCTSASTDETQGWIRMNIGFLNNNNGLTITNYPLNNDSGKASHVINTTQHVTVQGLYAQHDSRVPCSIATATPGGQVPYCSGAHYATYRVRLHLKAKEGTDGVYTQDALVTTSLTHTNTDTGNGSGSGNVARIPFTYEIRNGVIVPPGKPVSCKFNRILLDTSGLSSGTNIYHAYDNLRAGSTELNGTALTYLCDKPVTRYKLHLMNANLTLNVDALTDVKPETKMVVNNSTGELYIGIGTLHETGDHPPLSPDEFAFSLISYFTAKGPGIITYSDVLVITYD